MALNVLLHKDTNYHFYQEMLQHGKSQPSAAASLKIVFDTGGDKQKHIILLPDYNKMSSGYASRPPLLYIIARYCHL